MLANIAPEDLCRKKFRMMERSQDTQTTAWWFVISAKETILKKAGGIMELTFSTKKMEAQAATYFH